MSDIKPKRAILLVLSKDIKLINAKTIEHARAEQVLKIKELQEALDIMQKDVQALASARLYRSIRNQKKAINIVTHSFTVGYFSIVRHATNRGHKLTFKWRGFCRVTAAYRQLVYGVISLSSGKTERIHCARLLKYDDSILYSEVLKEFLDLAYQTETRYEVVDEIIDAVENNEGLWFQVMQDGLPDKRDYTWSSVQSLY